MTIEVNHVCETCERRIEAFDALIHAASALSEIADPSPFDLSLQGLLDGAFNHAVEHHPQLSAHWQRFCQAEDAKAAGGEYLVNIHAAT